MATLDRFSDRYYYETRFLDEGLPLWIWESGKTTTSGWWTYYETKEYVSGGGWIYNTSLMFTATEGNNSLLTPALLYTMESTPNYFTVDLYGISAGGYSAYHKHQGHYHFPKGHKYTRYYAGGGSGSVLYLANVKIRLKDENNEPIQYSMSGKGIPADTGGHYDWSVNPADVHTDPNDWCLKITKDYLTPNGIAPAGTMIIGMAAGGNAWQPSGSATYGNGASYFYIPRQCAFKDDLSTVPLYQPGLVCTVGMWIMKDGEIYRIMQDFTATDWEFDSRFCQVCGNFDANKTYDVGVFFKYNGEYYKTKYQFKGDEQNTVLGFSDYFLNKSEISLDIRRNGTRGGYGRNSPSVVSGGSPDRFFGESDINELNEYWIRKSLSWGKGQDNAHNGYGGQGGGLVMLYKGESS